MSTKDNTLFSISIRKDGIPSQFGNETDLDIDEALEELLYYNDFSEKYSEEELREALVKIPKNNYRIFFEERWTQTIVSKR